MRGRSESFISLGLAFVALASLASAQITTGAIRGTVTDSTGSVVPKVKVQAKNLATGQAFSADSSGAGVYLLGNLAIGNYKLEAQLSDRDAGVPVAQCERGSRPRQNHLVHDGIQRPSGGDVGNDRPRLDGGSARRNSFCEWLAGVRDADQGP